MSMSATRTVTFSATSARYLTSKIAADLRIMHHAYGFPTLQQVDEFADEAAQLMLEGYLSWVEYGLRRPTSSGGMEWVLQLRYTVNSSGMLTDDHPGGVPLTAPTEGVSFYSYLAYSSAFRLLPDARRSAIERALPVQRSSAPETPRAGGVVNGSRGYSRDGVTLARETFVAWEE